MSFYEEDEENGTQIEEFIKGFEVLKLRIGKLGAQSKELDLMVIRYFKIDRKIRMREKGHYKRQRKSLSGLMGT